MSKILRPSVTHLASKRWTVSYLWAIQFVTIPNICADLGFTSDDLNSRCESVDAPNMTGSPVEVQVRGNKAKSVGMYEYSGQITVTNIEAMDMKLAEFSTTWLNGCWSSENGGTGQQADDDDLQCQIMISLLNKKNEPIWLWNVFGCVLTDSGSFSLDGGTSDPLKPAWVLDYNYFTQKRA